MITDSAVLKEIRDIGKLLFYDPILSGNNSRSCVSCHKSKEYFTDTSFAVLVPKDGNAPPLVLQGVPEPRVAKNRMHLDIVVDDIELEVKRLQALGATRIDEGHQHFGDTLWVRMCDPEQNEFCVCTGVEW